MPGPPYTGLFNVTVGVDGSGNRCFAGQAPASNTASLQYMISKLLSSDGPTGGQGGTLQFPSAGPGTSYESYQFDGSITIGPDDASPPNTQPWSIILVGTGQQEISYPLLQQTAGDHLFIVDNNTGSSDDIGGVVFQDLMIGFTALSPPAEVAAIYVTGGSNNVNLLRVTFVDCPIGAWFEWSNGCSMIDCTAYNASTGGTPLILGANDNSLNSAIETYVAGCTFLSHEQPTGVGIQVYGCEHLRANNVRIEGYQQGIVIAAGNQGEGSEAANVRHLYFNNVSCYPMSDESGTGAAVVITTSSTVGSAAPVTEVWFNCCEFSQAETKGVTSDYTGAGIVIAPGTVGPIDQIRFVDCYSCLWNGEGMNISGGQNIEVLGGYYSCNGKGASPPFVHSQSGISITGNAQGVRITGAACNNSVYDLNASPPGFASATQLYGIYISNGAASVRILSCDLTGNQTNGVLLTGSTTALTNVFVKHCDFTGISAPVSVTPSVTNVQVTDCPGYNDQGKLVHNTAPGNATTFSATTYGYYGPVEFYTTGGGLSQIQVDGHNTNLAAGSFYLMPGETAQLQYSGVGTSFLMIGK